MGPIHQVPPARYEDFATEHASRFVQLIASAFERQLSYEPGDLGALDGIIDDCLEYPDHQREKIVRGLGAFVGEVCRRHLGCTWTDRDGEGPVVAYDGTWTDPYAWADMRLDGYGTLSGRYEVFRARCRED